MSASETHVFPRTSTARVATDRPARYGKQLASHMGRKITTTWDEDSRTGSLEFNREGPTTGVVELSCDGEVLVLRLSAATSTSNDWRRSWASTWPDSAPSRAWWSAGNVGTGRRAPPKAP